MKSTTDRRIRPIVGRPATYALLLFVGLGTTVAGCSSGAAARDDAATNGGADVRRSASYPITDLEGNDVGTLELQDGGRGLLLKVSIVGLSPGGHGLHLHETGRCDPPFESAGGHHAPLGRTHGFLTGDGPHVGDLPNLHVSGGGRETVVHAYAAGLRLADLQDEDGSAMIVHAGPDDYATDPAGAAGDRVACAAITPG